MFESTKRIPRKLTILFICTLAFINTNAQTLLPEIPQESHPYTRWWWHGSDVDSLNLEYNLTLLSQTGMGGVEITPIFGVQNREEHYIKFLSPKWMQMLEYTQDLGKRLGIQVDMNTGTGWPFGGPEITIDKAASKAVWQEYTIKKGSKPEERIIVKDTKQKGVAKLECLMAYSVDDNGNLSEKPIVLNLTTKVKEDGTLNWKAPRNSNYKLIALFIGKTLQKVLRSAPGGEGYVMDHLNKEAVQLYLAKFDKAFAENGTPYPNTFFNDSYEVIHADWTPSLLTEFKKRRGYKLENYFPDLLANGVTDQSKRVICDYRETISDLLLENFTETWAAWAHSHNVRTRNQAHGSPGNMIDLYAATDIPEYEMFGRTEFKIDGLRKDAIEKRNDGSPTSLKFASSAAHVSGKRLTSCESFTWTTEHFRTSMSQLKPEIDQMFTSGINHVFFHGTAYSPKDAAWPGWQFYAAIDISPKDPMWRDIPAFFSYISRVQSFMQDGSPDNDFLLYQPIYDIWNDTRGKYYMTLKVDGIKEQIPGFYQVVEEIRNLGYDADFISDQFIKSLRVTSNGKLLTSGGTIYKALILPAVNKIPSETWEHIKELATQGATIVAHTHFPAEMPGLQGLNRKLSPILNVDNISFDKVTETTVNSGRYITGKSYAGMLKKCAISESVVADYGAQMIRRKHDDGYHYFMAMLHNNAVDGWLPISVKATSAMLYNPMTGELGKAKIRQNGEKTEVYLQLKAGESIILKTFTDKNIEIADWKYYEETGNVIDLNNNWTMHFIESEPQIKTLFKLDNLKSWTELGNDTLTRNMGTARYTKKFNLNTTPPNEYRLVLGDVRESARIWVNGKDAGVVYAVPFEINIGKYLKIGENTLEIDVTNLPANRIADYDRRGVEWRIFKEINFVDLSYIKGRKYDDWQLLPSGLLDGVKIEELKLK